MPTEKELMLKQSDAETTYQKKLTAGTNITIDPVTNIISSAGGGSTVQYTDNTPNGESVGILAINGQSYPVRIPRLTEGTGITINKDITTNVYTISLSGGGGGTTKTYMGETNPDELVGENGDLYFKYHKIETDIPTELTLPSLPDDATVPFSITNFNSYDSFTFYYTDGNNEPHNRKVNIGDIVISDDPAGEYPDSVIYTWNSYRYVEATRSTNGEGLVLRVCGNCLYKLEANVTEVDLGIDKSYAKVEDAWLPSGEQVEANPEETSETPLTKIKIDGVTYYIAAGGSAEIVPLTKAEWDALPASKYTDNILYLITDSFTTETIITPNPEGEATDTLTKLQIDETIYSLAGGSGAAAVEKTQAEYDALTPAQKENGSIYMVQGEAEIIETPIDMSSITPFIEESSIMSVASTTDTTTVTYSRAGSSIGCTFYYTNKIDLTTVNQVKFGLETGDNYHQADSPQNPIHIGFCSTAPSGFSPTFNVEEEYYLRNHTYDEEDCIIDTSELTGEYYLTVISHGWNLTISDFILEDTGEVLANKIYYMGIEYANTNGGSGGGSGVKITTLAESQSTIFAPNDTITLSDNIDNYDLIICFHKYSNGEIFSSTSISVEDLIATTLRINTYYGAVGYNYINYVDETTLTNDVQSNVGIYKIIGIKFGSGGGSSIIPNPEEEPTDTLNSVKIDGTVYSIESNSEGEGVEIYSEDEYIVGSININGTKKKIYQKTFVLNNITVTQSDGYSYDITSLGIEDVVESPRGFVKITDSDRRSIPFNLLSGYGFTVTAKSNQILFERAGNNITVSQAVVTIRYTKTVETDAPAWGGSVNNYYANFIDTDNVIVPSTSWSGTMSYTATEDCYIVLENDAQNGHFKVTIDGVEVYDFGTSGQYVSIKQPFAIKKGQILGATSNQSNTLHYTVYGISYGSGGSSSESSVHYSTTEQVIGTWIDGKPLYQKTYENLNIGTDQNYNLTLSDLQDIEYLRVVPEGSQVSTMVPFPYVHYNSNNDISYFIDSITNGVPTLAIRKGYEMSSQSNLQFLTIQYTKTTD